MFLDDIKAELNDIEIVTKVKKNYCLMEWEVARYMEIIRASK